MAVKYKNESAFDGNTARKIEGASRALQVPQKRVPAPKNRDNLIRLTEKELRKARRRHINPLKVASLILCITVVFSLVAYSVYGQVQLTELTEKINVATTNLSQLESVEVQLQMKATSDMNVSEMEEYARTELGMEKINKNQVTYVNLASEDKGAVLVEESHGFFEGIMAFFGF